MMMKQRSVIAGLVAAALFSTATPVLAATAAGQDTVIDRVGDWCATIGKTGIDKDSILAHRRAERLAKRTSHTMEQGAEQAGTALGEAGQNLQQGLETATQ